MLALAAGLQKNGGNIFLILLNYFFGFQKQIHCSIHMACTQKHAFFLSYSNQNRWGYGLTYLLDLDSAMWQTKQWEYSW
jgi:hypothetical protein